MTNLEAADELERVANICTSTALSIAAMMGANALRAEMMEKGKWIGGELGHCSVCGHEGCASDIWTGCEQTRCPNCGALLELDGGSEACDCPTCKHRDRMPSVYPCSECEQRYSGVPSKWEPKEVDNGKTD